MGKESLSASRKFRSMVEGGDSNCFVCDRGGV